MHAATKFPTFARWSRRLGLPIVPWPWWLSSPWWPADSLAAKQQTTLRLLATAAHERLEFAPLVQGLAEEHRGRYRVRLQKLAHRLSEGTPLPAALEQTAGVLTDEQILAVRFGTQSGVLPQTLRAWVEQYETDAGSIGQRLRQVKSYTVVFTLLFLAVVTFMMIKIVPQWNMIMRDFSMERSRPLDWLIRISNATSQFALPLLLLVAVGLWLMQSERSRRYFRRNVLSRFLSPVTQLRSAGLLRLLAVAQEAGRPLPGSLSTLARYHYDAAVRHKLLYVRNEVEQGADFWQSMQQADLLSEPETRALTLASQSREAAPNGTASNNTMPSAKVWTIEKLADWKQARVANRLGVAVEFLLPVVILLMASAVLLVALAMLSPLYDTINALS